MAKIYQYPDDMAKATRRYFNLYIRQQLIAKIEEMNRQVEHKNCFCDACMSAFKNRHKKGFVLNEQGFIRIE